MTINFPDNISMATLTAALATLGLRLDSKRSPAGVHAAIPVADAQTEKHRCCGKCRQEMSE